MKSLPALVGLSLWIGAAQAQDCALEGTLGLGVLSLNASGADRAKLFEYRDVSSGALSLIDLTACIASHTIKLYGQNLGRDDAAIDLQGRDTRHHYRYQLYSDSLRHNFAFDARTPYSGAGSAQQSATFPNLTPEGWTPVDLAYRRRKEGGALEWNFSTQAYARFDVSQTRVEGNKLQSYAQGTSPTQGFVDLVTPVDATTKNFSLELGYHVGDLQLSLTHLTSRFDNTTPLVNWSNGFFNGTDASPLAPNNEMQRWSANAVLRNLPLRSTLALRGSTSRSSSDVDVLTTALSTPPGVGAPGNTPATNPSRGTFQGRLHEDHYALALTSNPYKNIDTRLTLSHLRKENTSSEINFTDLPTGLGCGDAPLTATTSSCLNERFDIDRRSYGLDVGVRLPHDNRLNFAYEAQVAERNREDTTRTQDDRYAIEWKNQSAERVSTRLKVQSLQRRADVASATLGTDPTDPAYLQRYLMRYDVTALHQTQVKLGLDVAAARNLDLGAEVVLKKNHYADTVLGRTYDERHELYLTLAYGDIRTLRLTAFAGWERVRYDSTHRNISAGTCPIIAPSLTPSPCFDPTQPATTTVYNWSATDRDRTRTAGLGFDWPARDRLMVRGSFIWTRAEGAVAVNPQTLASGAPAANLVGITHWGNSERYALSLKGDYRLDAHWSLTGGLSYEEMRFNDAQWDNATYLVPAAGSGTTTSYLTGAGANPAYTASWVYLMARYSF